MLRDAGADGKHTVGVLEAAYRLSAKTSLDWLTELAAAARPVLDQGLGVATRLFRVTPDGLEIGDSANDGADPRLEAASRASMAHAASLHADIFRATRVCTESELVSAVGTARPIAEMILAPMRAIGIRDTLTVQICDTDGHGIFVAAPLEREATLDDEMRQRWQRIATHLLTAARLRRAIASGHGQVALELAPNGTLSIEDESLSAPRLRERVVDEANAIRHVRAAGARATAERSGDRVLDVWRGLVAGNWSVIDRADGQDARYLVLRRNPPPTASASASAQTSRFSTRETQVAAYLANGWTNKEIAYALGITISSIATLVARLKKKLNVASRVQLVIACAQLRPAP